MNSSHGRRLLDEGVAYLSRQLILGRDDKPYGSEVRVLGKSSAISNAGTEPLVNSEQARFYSQMLAYSQSTAFSLRMDKIPHTSTLRRFFVCVERSELNDSVLVDELVRTGEALCSHGQVLVVVLSSMNSRVSRFKITKNIVQHVYHLKDHGVEVALEVCSPSEGFPEVLAMLDLFNFIKIPVPQLGFDDIIKHSPDFFNRIYDWMSEQRSRTSIAFVAEQVDCASSNSFARGLPFDYFQGEYYAPAGKI